MYKPIIAPEKPFWHNYLQINTYQEPVREPLAKLRHSGMFLAGIHFLDL
jgi:hypothetical protein